MALTFNDLELQMGFEITTCPTFNRTRL